MNIGAFNRRESSLERLAFHARWCRCSSSLWKRTLVYSTDVAKIPWCRIGNFRKATGNDRALLHWRNDLFILWDTSAIPLHHPAELPQDAFLRHVDSITLEVEVLNPDDRSLFCKSASGKKCQRNYPTKKQTTKSTAGNTTLQKAKNDCKRSAHTLLWELQKKERGKQKSNVFCFSGFVCLLIAGFLRLTFFACVGWTSFRFAFSDLFFLFLFAICSNGISSQAVITRPLWWIDPVWPGIVNVHLARRTLSEVLLKNSRTSEVRLANHQCVVETWPTNYFDLPYMYCIGQTQKKSGTAMISSGPAVSVKFLLPNSGQIKRRLGLGIGKRLNQKHGGIAMTVCSFNELWFNAEL